MKVALLGMGWPPDEMGGLSRYVSELHGALVRAGVTVVPIVLGPARSAPIDAVIPASSSDSLALRMFGMTRAALAVQPDVDVVDTHFSLYAAPIALANRGRNPMVSHFHGPWASESDSSGASRINTAIKRRVEGLVYRRADRLIVLSDAFREELTRYGVGGERIRVVHPGVDLSRFRVLDTSERKAARERLGLPLNRPVIIAVRRLVPRMGLDVLLQAWDHESVAAASPLLVIVGDGPDRSRLKQLAVDMGTDSVRFTGLVTDEDLPLWFGAADVAVTPSVALEGWGLVLLEAMAAGTPVVASDVGGIAEAVAGFPHDCLVPPGDPAALSRALIRVISALPAPGMRSDARIHAERYSWDATAQGVIAVYEEAISRKSRQKLLTQ